MCVCKVGYVKMLPASSSPENMADERGPSRMWRHAKASIVILTDRAEETTKAGRDNVTLNIEITGITYRILQRVYVVRD